MFKSLLFSSLGVIGNWIQNSSFPALGLTTSSLVCLLGLHCRGPLVGPGWSLPALEISQREVRKQQLANDLWGSAGTDRVLPALVLV